MVQDFYHPPWSLCPFFCGLGSHFLRESSQFFSNKIRFTAWIPEPGCFSLFNVNYDEPMYPGPYFHSNSQDELQETLCKLLESPSAPRVRSNLSRHLGCCFCHQCFFRFHYYPVHMVSIIHHMFIQILRFLLPSGSQTWQWNIRHE